MAQRKFELAAGFPNGLSDPELEKAITYISSEVAATSGAGSTGDMDLYLSLLQAALQEQLRRGIAETSRQSREASDRARSATRISIWVAIAALFVAIFGTVGNYLGDRSWQHDPERILT